MEHGILLSDVDFMIHGIFQYSFFGHQVWITTSHVCILIVMLILIGFAIAANRAIRKGSEVPRGFQNVVELIVEKLDGVVDGSMGHAAPRYYNYIGTIFNEQDKKFENYILCDDPFQQMEIPETHDDLGGLVFAPAEMAADLAADQPDQHPCRSGVVVPSSVRQRVVRHCHDGFDLRAVKMVRHDLAGRPACVF